MEAEKTCDHCGGSGTCDKIKADTSCPDCCEAQGLDWGYFRGYVPCSVCNGTGKIEDPAD